MEKEKELEMKEDAQHASDAVDCWESYADRFTSIFGSDGSKPEEHDQWEVVRADAKIKLFGPDPSLSTLSESDKIECLNNRVALHKQLTEHNEVSSFVAHILLSLSLSVVDLEIANIGYSTKIMRS